MFRHEENSMQIKFVLPAIAILTATMAVPAYAQYEGVYGPGYSGPGYYGPIYRHRIYRDAYIRSPLAGPFYNDGWVPESIYDHSRAGGIDPNIRPSN
jgi:hypothetical protein